MNIFYISGVLCLIFAVLYCSFYYRYFSRQHGAMRVRQTVLIFLTELLLPQDPLSRKDMPERSRKRVSEKWKTLSV